MVSMECDAPEPIEVGGKPETPAYPLYPYGLSISMDEKVLDKLNVDFDDWEVGDVFLLKNLVKITSKSENESTDGKRCRVEMQIIAISGQIDDEENEEDNEAD